MPHDPPAERTQDDGDGHQTDRGDEPPPVTVANRIRHVAQVGVQQNRAEERN